jgi:microcystin degradation protein MlrC
MLRDQLLDELQLAMPVDIVLLGLHGAMVAQECDDCEGELIESVRKITGADTLIGVTFDPHSHLSERRTSNADIITVFKEFPHTDFVKIAEDLVHLAHRASTGEISPAISVFDCRMIEILPTSREPMRSFIDRISALEGRDEILSISVIHGFMAGDVADLGCKIIVITDNALLSGDALAAQLGKELFSFRGRTRPEFLDPDSALDQASCYIKTSTAPVVIADVWDNPGGGVAGDSTIILNKLSERNIKNAALATIWDPIAVRTCISAGRDAKFKLRFGGKMSDKSGEPIDAEVIVRNIVKNATQSFCQSLVPIGDSVWIEVDGIDVILNSVRSQVFDTDIFYNMGIDPNSKALLIVKSTNHFYASFSKIASSVLYAAIDGPYPNDPANTHYTKLNRPIWPRVENPHDNDQQRHRNPCVRCQ